MRTSAKFKGLIFGTILTLCGANVNAQKKSILGDPKNYDQGFRLGFGFNGGFIPDDLYDFAIGGDIRLQYDFSKKTSITLTTGFTNLFVSNEKDLGFIPVKGGFKMFWWEDRFYALAEVGVGFPVTNDYDDTVDNTLIISPGIGYATKYVDLSLRYEHYTEFPSNDGLDRGMGQIALRLAYGFRL